MLSTPILLVLAIGLVVAIGVWRRVEIGRLIAWLIFGIYLVGVANFVILPLKYDPALAAAVGPLSIERLIELKPFFFPGGTPMSDEQLYLNVLLTIPFGFGLPFVTHARLATVLAIGVAFSLGIELAQLIADVTYLALPTWSIDINDVLLNSFGVVIGLGLFVATSGMYRALFGRVRLSLGPLQHFDETLRARRLSL